MQAWTISRWSWPIFWLVSIVYDSIRKHLWWVDIYERYCTFSHGYVTVHITDSASENQKIPCNAPFSERVDQTKMNNSRAFTTLEFFVTMAPLQPIGTKVALKRPHSDDPIASIIPSAAIYFHIRASSLGCINILDLSKAHWEGQWSSVPVCTEHSLQ